MSMSEEASWPLSGPGGQQLKGTAWTVSADCCSRGRHTCWCQISGVALSREHNLNFYMAFPILCYVLILY